MQPNETPTHPPRVTRTDKLVALRTLILDRLAEKP